MNICIFEDDQVEHLNPLALTRPVYDLRMGLRTRAHDLQRTFENSTLYLHCRNYLAAWTAREYDALVNRIPTGLDVLFINGRLLPDADVSAALSELVTQAQSRVILSGTSVVAAWVPSISESFPFDFPVSADSFTGSEESEMEARFLTKSWDLLDGLEKSIESSFRVEVAPYNIFERPGADIHEAATLIGGENIYVGPGAGVRPGVVLDATNGPIYIAENARVFENAVIHGPTIVGEKSQIRIGASLQNVIIGPVCKVGGEVHDSIIHSYSSKVHDGFLGHACVGRWCNLGAGTNNSNLRNDYGLVPMFNASDGMFQDTGRQFLGLIMADHSKCAIGTTFNTGTTVGVSCNLFGAGLHPRFIPSFMWGCPPDQYLEYRFDKSVDVAAKVMGRRDIKFDETDKGVMQAVHRATHPERALGVVK